MRERLYAIQALRALAALAVVTYHSIETVSRALPSGTVNLTVMDLGWLGNFGVDVFFVISGFIMIYSHYDDFAVPGSQWRFLSNRFRRIVPNYWALTMIGALVILLMPSLSSMGRTFDPYWVFASLMFIPYASNSGIQLPVLGLGWTLNYEMYFYFVFSFVLLLPRRLGLLIMALWFLASIAIGSLIEPHAHSPLTKQMTSWLLIEFLMGICVGVAFKKGAFLRTIPATLLLVSIIPMLFASLHLRENGTLSQVFRLVFFGYSAIAILSAATLCNYFRKIRVPKILLLLGSASYSLYLTHVFTLPFAYKIISEIKQHIPFELAVLFLIVLSAIVAIIFYSLFEKPVERFLRPAQKIEIA